MGRSLSTASKELTPTPVVQVRGEVGQFFEGKLLSHKTTKSKWLKEDGTPRLQHIFEFAIQDTDMELQIKKNDEYIPADVSVGETVAIFPPTRLANGLIEAQIGEIIRIEYLGVGKAGRRGGKPHLYKVEVI